jgi:alpha(1,3/1,4) fucosyltransferase
MTSRPDITIAFRDFWRGFDPHDNWWLGLLQQRFAVTVADDAPITLYSVFGYSHRAVSGTRVLVSWENMPWSFARADWAFTSDLRTSRYHCRVPLWVSYLDFLGDPQDYRDRVSDPAQRQFCSVVVSSGGCVARDRIHALLDTYRTVASGGRHRNNVGGPVADKLSFIAGYKFHLACENSSYPGYATEKLLHGLYAHTVPIYWGDPCITRDFNPDRFLRVANRRDERTLIDRVRELDRDDAAYGQMLAEPWFRVGDEPAASYRSAALDQFERIAGGPRRRIVSRSVRNVVARGPVYRQVLRIDRMARGAAQAASIGASPAR